MAMPNIPAEQQFPPRELEAFLPPGTDWTAIRERDEAMIAELRQLNQQVPAVRSLETGLDFACGELAALARRDYDERSLADIEQFLTEHGTLDLPVVEGYQVTVDDIERDLILVAATEITANGANHGEMSSMLYLRDQIQTAEALIKLSLADPGRDLLISALHLMSTPSQLERCNDVIRRGAEAGQADWPQISLYFDDLAGSRPNGWRNKQDTLQMLAYTTLEAIEQGFLDTDELAEAHKQFLGSVVPLLAAVGFPHYESSGSWEEVTAHRTSVLAIETALLYKIQKLANGRHGLEFLKDDRIQDMLQSGLLELGNRLPFESHEYDPGSVKRREADAALAYVLRYGLPQLLAANNVPMAANHGQPMAVEAIEDLVLDQLERLIDRQSGGIVRYQADSYQRVNFHTNSVQLIIKAIKRKVLHDAMASGCEINLDAKQSLRDRLTPAGQPAAWTHPLGQIASWAAGHSLQARKTGDADGATKYRDISQRYLNAMLSIVTGTGQWHAVLDKGGQYKLTQVPSYRMPECSVAYMSADGSSFRVPSPHTPLNWSSAMLKETIGIVRQAMKSRQV